MSYPHNEIDQKWQKKWAEADAFKAKSDSELSKYYALDMFPYPSGQGLHVGHMASYTPTDVISRYKRTQGFNVLHPIGYDAFGLPAEQYAIQTGVHPAETTRTAIENFRRQLKSFGFSFDWSREISTCEPNYYKWTQFIFTKLYDQGLAYQKEVPVNWCPALKTVLANEEVVDGKSERGGHPVVRVPMKQWMLKITAYAEKLLEGLDRIDWPERTKEGQRNWIGKSEGAHVTFNIYDSENFSEQAKNPEAAHTSDVLEVFTTRPDTLYGVTFMVVAPEHPLVGQLVSEAQKKEVELYIQTAAHKSEIDRKASTEKTGVFTGGYAVHPLTKEKIPIWVSDYVLMDYGTGAIMAVPGHDSRDFEFAEKFGLKITRVIESELPLPYEGDGIMVNSGLLDGLSKKDAITNMIDYLEENALGKREIQYKLRDWLFSRQRYWGEPFPIVKLSDGTLKSLPIDELPVTLPPVADYEPTENGEPPLARVADFVSYDHFGVVGQRETDTMPGSAGSSWYFLRFADPLNAEEAFSFKNQKYWMPVDLYVGGAEHTVGHLLYARFWQKVLFDAGLVSHDEPFQKLAHQGMILGPDGEKMSKSRGNVVNPDEVRTEHGSDALRAFILFLGPMDRDKPWNPNGIDGVKRFLDRLWRLAIDSEGNFAGDSSAPPEAVNKLLHKTIKKVGEDIESMGFNTAISAMMILLNELYKTNCKSKSVLKPFVQLLAPFAPHLCEELWEAMGETGFVSLATWPTFDPAIVVENTATMGVQVNGKMKGTVELSFTAEEKEAVEIAKSLASVAKILETQQIQKVIYKAGKILNLIVK